MAYGKLKADTLVYDNSGSDVEVTISSLGTKASTTGETFTGDILIDNQKELRLGEPDGAGTNYVGFEAPDTIASNVVWKLPNADGSASQYLKTDGSGNLSWGSDSAGIPTTGGTFTGNVALNDDVEFQFGAGSGGDLKIYHNGTSHDSFIEERGTGNLKIAASQVQFLNAAKDETTAIFTEDAGAALYYNNASKLTTATGGVDVTGNIDLTGSVVFEGATADAHETTLAVTDPTADRTITLPNATGTVALTSDITVTLATDQTWSGSQRGAINALTSATTITIDFNAGNNHSVTLAHNTTFANPTNQAAGQSGSIFITQDGTGSRTAAWGGNFKWKGGTAPTLSTAAASVDRVDYICLASGTIHAVASLDVK